MSGVATMEWTRKEVLDFVEFYKQKPILWDPRHPEFHNRPEKSSVWVDVAHDMGRSVDECKKKMDYLLAAVRREKQKIKKTVGVGKEAYDMYKSKWYAFDSLRFLLDKSSNYGDTSYIKTEGDVEESEWESEEAIRDLIIPDIESNVESTSVMTVSVNPRKRRATFEDRFESPMDIVRTTNEDLNDDCQLFGNLIAAKLRKFNEDVKTCLQSEIMALFVKASRGAYINPASNRSEQTSDTH